MKIASNIEQYFDDEGRPLVNGRVSFYKHDSDTLADIFYLEGDQYDAAPNPIITADDGRVPTIWFEATVLDVKVEKCLPDGSYELMDTFQIGFDYPKAANDTLTYGIEGLQNTDPAVGIVQVVGYWDNYDAPARWYVWDANCTLAADGGVIIESSVGEEGRWILLWDDELLPSSVYGIIPGSNEANVSSFLNYPDFVGTYQIRTPAMPRFLSGTYTTDTTYGTLRTVYFDRGAKFTRARINCNNAIILENDNYVCDLGFDNPNVVAHSSWFRTAQMYWHCGADKYIIDYTNYMTDYRLTTTAYLGNKVIEGARRLPTTYVNNAYLKLTNCTILGSEIFSARYDKIQFNSMLFKESWFVPVGISYWDFGSISGGHNIEVMTGAAGNIIRYQEFSTPDVYLKACLANGDTVFDGHEGVYSAYTSNTQFVVISNAEFSSQNGLTDSACGTWTNVYVRYGLSFTGGNRSIWFNSCRFHLKPDTTTNSITYASFKDCTIEYGGTWCVSYTALSVNGGTWSAKLELSAAAKSARSCNKDVSFANCTISYSNSWAINHISMVGCTTNLNLKLVPYNDNGTLRNFGNFVGNTFTLGALITVDAEDPSTETDVYNVVAALVFKDNKFNQTDSRGIVIPHLTNGFDRTKPYLSIYSSSVYTNNTGNCPQEHPTPIFLSREMTEELSFGTWSLKYMPRLWGKRVWNLNPNPYYTNGYGWMCTPDFSESWNIYTGRNASMYEVTLLHYAYLAEGSDNNDQFEVVHCWRDSDDFSDERFVVCPVLDYGH